VEEDTEKKDMDLKEVYAAFSLACILVALLMGILFEHILLPLAVLVSIPFAWVGAFFTLWITGTPRDMVSMIGLIILVGIVVNNGIVLLDCAHRLIRDGMSRREALIEAGRLRLRPILMTAGTTIIGLLPMAIADDSLSMISYQGLARGVAGGLFLSTVCTLIAVPVAYSLIDDAWQIVRRQFGAAVR
jgi:HAE1 family hydrophobic/amphiphilic exporter-1